MRRNHSIMLAAKSALLAITVTLLSSCAGMGSGYETPTVTVQSFRAVPSDTGSGLPSFEIGLHVTNPNLDPLELVGVSYSISLNGQKIINGVGNQLPVIDAYGEGTFTVTAGVNILSGIRLLRSLMDTTDGNFDYAFEAKLDPGAYRRKIRVRDSGSIALNTT
ncbi:MAG: LEA type 2 family protein [Gammaproteobacteria bacterium]|nr:LEA type 2 family protein [Gammaproteobacteria bacterium]